VVLSIGSFDPAWHPCLMPDNVPINPLLLLGLGLATWMEFYTYDGVNLVLPDIAGGFGLSQDQASWILTVYLAALFYGVPVSIWLAGHIGYKRYVIGTTAWFALSSLGCILAPDFPTLLLCRAAQGFAGAGLVMWWRASVYTLFTGPQRSASLMRVSVILYLGTASGLLFSGWITDNFSWRLLFVPDLVCAPVSIALLRKHFPDIVPPPSARAADWPGLALLGLAIIALQILLARGDVDDWFSATQIQALGWVACVAAVAFGSWQLHPSNKAPLLKLRLITDRNLQAAICLGLFAGLILSGALYAMPEFLRNTFPSPLSATQTGRIMCVYALTAAAIRPLVTPAIAKFGPRKVIGFAFLALIAAMLSAWRLLTLQTPPDYYVLPLVLYAFCLAPMLSAIGSGAVSKLPAQSQLDAVAIYMSFRQFGAALGITLVTTLLNWRETLHSSRLLELPNAVQAGLPAWLQTVASAAQTRAGAPPMQARPMALAMLARAASAQAQTLSYADAFLVMGAIGVPALAAVALMAPFRKAPA
jgi:EmrB/QacA subfamily drug resistance transporter